METPTSPDPGFWRSVWREETWGFPPLDPDVLTKPRWSEDKHTYFRFRVLLCIYWTFWVLIQGSQAAKGTHFDPTFAKNNGDQWDFFLYVTSWTMVLEGVVFLLALLCTVQPDRRHLHGCYWALRTVLGPSAVLVTLLYWMLVYSGHTSFADVHAHAINSAVMLLDLTVSRLPLQLKHAYCPALYISVYMAFNATWCLNGGRDADGNPYIYGVLTFGSASERRSSAVLFVLILFLAFPVVHVFLVMADRLCRAKIGPGDQKKPPTLPSPVVTIEARAVV